MAARRLQNHDDDNSDNGSDVATAVSGFPHSRLVGVFQAPTKLCNLITLLFSSDKNLS